MKQKKLISFAVLSITALVSLIACGQTPVSSSINPAESSETPAVSSEEPPAPSSEAPAFEATINLDPIEEEFNIHTEAQENYMKDAYGTINTYAGSGSTENSKPRSLDLSWSVEASDVTLKNIRLDLYENEELEEPVREIILAADAKTTSITNLKLDQSYYWTITAIDSEDKEVTSEASSFKTADGVGRFISIDGLSNVRDCGGWTGLDGKKIKQGLLYRGEEFNQQNNGRKGSGSTATIDPTKVDPDDAVERQKSKPYGQKISAAGIETVLYDIKLKTECDIRGYETFDYETRVNEAPTECGGLKDGNGIIQEINYVITPVHTDHDKIYYDSYGKAASKKFFQMLADEENLPVYFHCAQGKDRTGFIAYLFQTLLGCSAEDCMRDYLMSNFGKTGTVSESKLVGSSANYNYVDYFKGNEVSTKDGVKYTAVGATPSERAYNYLLECGVTSEELDHIIEIFLED